MKRLILLSAALLAVCMSQAAIRMPHLFSDGMVIQQRTSAPVWGWADPGSRVSVAGSWGPDAKEFKADALGKWSGRIDTPVAGGPYTITVSEADGKGKPVKGGGQTVIRDVMVGEVWLMSGQSNMKFPTQSIENAEAELADAEYPLLRFFTVKPAAALAPVYDVESQWTPCTAQTAKLSGAIPFLFGRGLQRHLGVAVGVIQSHYGGSSQEAWLNAENFSDQADLVAVRAEYIAGQKQLGKGGEQRFAGGLYDAMLTPLIPYAIKGIGWYQGEGNSNDAARYRVLLERFVNLCRREWGDPQLPFIVVQLSGWHTRNVNWVEVQMEQFDISQRLKNVATVVCYDAGDAGDVHPKRKQPVAERMLLAARGMAYGEDIGWKTPSVEKWSAQGEGKAVVTFKNCGQGLTLTEGESANNFMVSDGGHMVEAQAVILSPSTVELTAPGLGVITKVWYAGKSFNPDVNLFNSYGIPVTPYKSDYALK